jgi:hypothetical protein
LTGPAPRWILAAEEEAMADVDDLLRLDYDETTRVVHALAEIRFKLLAFVPTISGASVAVLSRPTTSAERLAVGLIGLVATLGVFMYELRNTQLHDAALARAKALEERLGFVSLRGDATGGPYSERPARSMRLGGALTIWHDRALSLVYAAALAGWSYLVAWGGLRLVHAAHAQKWAAGIAVLAGAAVVIEVQRLDARPKSVAPEAAAPTSVA